MRYSERETERNKIQRAKESTHIYTQRIEFDTAFFVQCCHINICLLSNCVLQHEAQILSQFLAQCITQQRQHTVCARARKKWRWRVRVWRIVHLTFSKSVCSCDGTCKHCTEWIQIPIMNIEFVLLCRFFWLVVLNCKSIRSVCGCVYGSFKYISNYFIQLNIVFFALTHHRWTFRMIDKHCNLHSIE